MSLIAQEVNAIVGHIAFSPVRVESAKDSFEAPGLGLMSVLPDYQRKGIGTYIYCFWE